MRTILLSVAMVVASCLLRASDPANPGKAAASTAVADVSTTADSLWTELENEGLLEIGGPKESFYWPRSKSLRWWEERSQLRRAKGIRFFELFPDDPRRWWLVRRMSGDIPRFIISYGPNFENDPGDVVIDKAAAAAWERRIGALAAQMWTASDAPAGLREELYAEPILQQIREIGPKNPGWEGVVDRLGKFAEAFPRSEQAANLVGYFVRRFGDTHGAAEVEKLWLRFVDSPNHLVAAKARDAIQAAKDFAATSQTPLELSFTALDGRQIDLHQLRGKIILIDFWATWCIPCMLEMPNVQKAYERYHDKGLEIIGVSCDYAPGPGLKGVQAQSARTGPEVLEFARTHGMPWPQYYEGKKHGVSGGHSLAARFNVTGIPATFLLDQSGRIVATDLRGEALEEAIARLVGNSRASGQRK